MIDTCFWQVDSKADKTTDIKIKRYACIHEQLYSVRNVTANRQVGRLADIQLERHRHRQIHRQSEYMNSEMSNRSHLLCNLYFKEGNYYIR